MKKLKREWLKVSPQALPLLNFINDRLSYWNLDYLRNCPNNYLLWIRTYYTEPLPSCRLLELLCYSSLATGSSWTTSGTVGIALRVIGCFLGFPPEMVAGAVISGSYFGDKMSPLSDTTNPLQQIAGTDLFTHIKKNANHYPSININCSHYFSYFGFRQKVVSSPL